MTKEDKIINELASKHTQTIEAIVRELTEISHIEEINSLRNSLDKVIEDLNEHLALLRLMRPLNGDIND